VVIREVSYKIRLDNVVRTTLSSTFPEADMMGNPAVLALDSMSAGICSGRLVPTASGGSAALRSGSA
jgi:hypothetical protein